MINLSKREYIEKALKQKDNSKAIVAGWVDKIKVLGKIAFLTLRDSSGLLQIVSTDKNIIKQLSKLTPESVIICEGTIKKGKQKSGEKELILKEYELINKAETPLPIDLVQQTTNIDKRIDFRALDLRNKKTQAIFKIQSEILYHFREFFHKEDFIEFQTPSIISSASEGGTELFPITYFERRAYLAQSPQLYKQMGAISLEKVTIITPVWRAEKHDTIRHLNESRQMDIEVAFTDEFMVMKYLEKVIMFIIKNIKKTCRKELEILNVKLKEPKFKYLTYTETVKLLKIKYGEDLTPEDERSLDKLYPDTVVFIHDWPLDLKPFYIMPKSLNKNEKLSKGFDAIYKGMEISSGGQRIHLPELIIERLKAKGLDSKNFKSYIDSFRHGAPHHSGFSIGLERFTMALLNLKNIRECCLFPRDRVRLHP
ncbi:MAG: aspartate--tRNA(Asn) ligase [Nanoarchaeota archaeon]|nr:aspartate--tRNA(Asn) ligase [Nanoarchaeota archaeon]